MDVAAAVAQDLTKQANFQSVSALILENDAYWLQQNKTLKELNILKGIVKKSNATLRQLAEQARTLQTNVLPNTPGVCLMPLYEVIIMADSGNPTVGKKLNILQKSIKDFSELQEKQKTLAGILKSQEPLKKAQAYLDLGLWYQKKD